MITILGILLFICVTGLVLWQFSEAVWREGQAEGTKSTQPSEEEEESKVSGIGFCATFDEPA